MMKYTVAIVALAALSGFAHGESCYCPEKYNPVCASNGQVFSNLCMLRCHNFNNHDNLQVAEFDKCSHKQVLDAFPFFPPAKFNCFRRCPHTPLNVCGSDGVTYGSSCALNCVKKFQNEKRDVVEVHRGPCKSQTFQQLVELKFNCFRLCPHIPLPVCGSDGVTYGSSCALNCVKKIHNDKQNVVKIHNGPCSSKIHTQVEVEQVKNAPVCVCTDEYMPVCGNDLHTYPNMCTFECYAKKNSALTLMYHGRCIILP